ncbi:MAG: SPOR domain-containing protein [Paramuribaculum sp.]|nr:SPOR domain-containing protein [Paramuribaculum sp.]
MKKIYIAAAIAAIAFTGCKTTEANYRAAYEIAKQKQENADEDGPAAKLQQFAAPKETVADGITLMMHTEPVGFIADGGATRETLLKYNVVVGRFRQLFNARQMRARLIAAGYDNACVVSTRDAGYYVIAETCATAAEAAKGIERVKTDTSLSLRTPLPYILRPAHLAR